SHKPQGSGVWQQNFENMIKKGLNITPTNEQIIITTSNDSKGQLHVEIADTGLGIEAEAMPKIFDAFEQGGRTQLGGLGLGLAISKTLVQGSKGTITTQCAGRTKAARFTLACATCAQARAQI